MYVMSPFIGQSRIHESIHPFYLSISALVHGCPSVAKVCELGLFSVCSDRSREDGLDQWRNVLHTKSGRLLLLLMKVVLFFIHLSRLLWIFFNLLVVVTREWYHSVSEDVILPLTGTVFKRSETIHWMQTLNLGSCFNTKTVFPDMGSSMMKIRRSWECLIVITGILFAEDQMWFPISTVYMHQFKKHRIELDSVCANTISAARSILTWKQFWQYIFSGSLKKCFII